MKYMILLTGDEDEIAARPLEDGARAIQTHQALERELQSRGKFLDGDPLQPKRAAVTVRRRGEGFVVTDGPFVETREHLGGFYLIEADSLEEALGWARKLKPPTGSQAFEVRPARMGAQWHGPVRGKERYMLLFAESPERMAPTPDELMREVDRHLEVSLELAAQSRFWGGRSLGPPSAAKTLRPGGGGTVVTDGPFAETREVVAGYVIVACDAKDEAVEIAKALCSEHGAVEVRPIWDIHERSRARSSDASSRR
jgi:hypothetical protein